MRYQNYKAKMMKIRKVLDVFYHLRFVFIGVAVVTAASITTLDLTKGNITEVSKFEISYTYGDDIQYSGSAFMGNVSFEFRRKGEESWTEDKPRFVGKYEARAKSLGNHGYKYSDISSFEIKPYKVDVSITSSTISFGCDNPALTYTLLPGDTLNKDYIVNYEDKTVKETKASIDETSLKVTDKDGVDVTSCYEFTCEDKDITFAPAPIVVTFDENKILTYDGNEYTNDGFKFDKDPYYGAHVEVTPGVKVSKVGKHDNTHEIKIVDGDLDYTANYNITRKVNGSTGTDNYIQINKLPAIHIASGNLSKTYDGKPFNKEEFEKSITVTGNLFPGHKVKITKFARDEIKDYTPTALTNEFEFDIVDSKDNHVDFTSDESIYQTPTISFGTVRISKRPLSFEFASINEVFKNIEYKNSNIVESSVNGLLPDHQIVVDDTNPDYDPPFIDPTDEARLENKWHYTIKEGETDVTDNYDISVTPGAVNITKVPLKFEFTANTGILYDGLEHPYYIGSNGDNHAVLADGYSLPDGWEYEVYVNNKMKDYSETGYTATEDDVFFSIIDNSDPSNPRDVSSCYDLDDFEIEFPTASIVKRPVQITYKNYTTVKEYDGQPLSNDIIIDPNAPGSCVECETGTLEGTSGLIPGHSLDVNFVTSGSTYDNPNNARYANKDGEKYKFGLSYSIRDDTNSIVTNNYEPSFTTDLDDNEQAITASIARKTIVVSTDNTSKTYDGTTSFTPVLSTIHTGELGEKVDFDNIVKNSATVSDSIAGEYNNYLSDYENLADHVIIRDGTTNADISSNYNIVVQCTGKLTIDRRYMTISSNFDYNNGDRIAYDNKPHGVFTNADGSTHSAETSYEVESTYYNSGLLNGHRVVMSDGKSITEEGDLDIIGPTNETFGTKIYAGERDVTDSYIVGYTDFRLRVVKSSISINPKFQTKAFDGLPFEVPGLENVPFGEYRNYTSSEMQKLYTVSFLSGATLQSNHELQVTKYTKETSDAYVNVGTDNHYYEYSYRVIDKSDPNNPTDVTNLYNIDAPQTYYRFEVKPSSIYISCNGGGNTYTGANCEPPGSSDWFALSFDTSKPAYMVESISSIKKMDDSFFTKYSVQAKFDDASDPLNMWRVGTYYFPVSIRIEDLETHEYKEMHDIDGMDFQLVSDRYGYTISKRKITVTSQYYPAKGQEKRSVGGAKLASGDVLYFGDYFGDDYEPLKSGRVKYNKPLTSVVIIRNGTYDVTDCYDITYIS